VRAAPTARFQSLRQRPDPIRSSAVPDEKGPRQGDHLHITLGATISPGKADPGSPSRRGPQSARGRAAPEFARDDHSSATVAVGNCRGLVFGTSAMRVEDLETYLGTLVGRRRPPRPETVHATNHSARSTGRSWRTTGKLYAGETRQGHLQCLRFLSPCTGLPDDVPHHAEPAGRSISDGQRSGKSFQPAQDGLRRPRDPAELQGGRGRNCVRHRPQAWANNSIIDPVDE